MLEVTFFSIALVATALGIAAFRRYGTAVGTFDVPNERSSHASPTLRGGGVVIVAVCLLLYIAASYASGDEPAWSFVAGAIIVSSVSWMDDAWTLPAWVRFAAHSAAALVLITGSGALGPIIPGLGPGPVAGLLSYSLTFLWIVWMINAYNFMDGIDGIAGAQAVVAGVGWAVVGLWSNDPLTYIFGGVVAFSSLGFLLHNWSPARVFMGDVGSAFLGYTFAAMPLIAQPRSPDRGPWLVAAAISFVWLFLFDTVFTLLRRLKRKEKVWLAHRQHVYQRLVILGWRHATVSLLYGALAVVVAAAFIAAFASGGIWPSFVFFIYLAVPAVVAFLAFRKKI